MYSRFISSAINRNVQQSRARVYPFNFFSSLPAHPTHKDSNLVDDIRPTGLGSETRPDDPVNVVSSTTKLGTGFGSGSEIGADDRVNVMKSTTAPSSSTYERREENGSYVAETAKQGVAKALETGLEIGEMAKKTLDNVWDLTKDTAHKVKEAVTGDPHEKNDVPPTDRFVDDLRNRAGCYDLKKKGQVGK